jgi:hypothetical protein
VRFGRIVLDALVGTFLISICDLIVVEHRYSSAMPVAAAFASLYALNAVGITSLVVPLAAFVRWLRRTENGRRIGAFATDDATRARALIWLVVIGLALLFVSVTSLIIGTHIFVSFRNQNVAIGALISIVVALEIGSAVTIAVVMPTLLERIGRHRAALWIARHRHLGPAAFLICFGACFALVHASAVSWFEPADPMPIYQGLIAASVSLAVQIVSPLQRCGKLGALVVGVSAAASVCVGGLALCHKPIVREAALRYGVVSKLTLRTLDWLGDRDGDGFSAILGGTDCDDSNATISPRGYDIPNNLVDENCTGKDSHLGESVHRLLPQPSRSDVHIKDIILITLDTLRADHLGWYGYSRSTSPNLDAFAARAVSFEHAFATAPLTRLSLPSILYGRYAHTLPFSAGSGATALAMNSLPSLATELSRTGFATHAIMSVSGLMQDSWLRGFETAEILPVGSTPASASTVTDAILRVVGVSERPSFVWAHYFDTHHPYSPGPGATSFGPRDIDRYDSEISDLDRQIGRLLRGLMESGRLDRTVIVITADHGEAFGDHGNVFHGTTLYNEQTHVPLFFFVPGLPPRRVDGSVSLVDVASTLLDLAGVTAPAGMNGRSLWRTLRDGSPRAGSILTELFRDGFGTPNQVSLLHGANKLIWNQDSNRYEHYDLDTDWHELAEVVHGTSSLRTELQELIDAEFSTFSNADVSQNQ